MCRRNGFKIKEITTYMSEKEIMTKEEGTELFLMTNEDFIFRAKAILSAIDESYTRNHKRAIIDFDKMSDEDLENLPSCARCNGTLYYEGGGEIHDCTSCADGLDIPVIFDKDQFAEDMENIMFEGTSFFELMHSKPTTP